jgi:methylated-DNA-[protein]-cysteine S-methyltransferase
MCLVVEDAAIVGLYTPGHALADREATDARLIDARDARVIELARAQLEAYFAGTLTRFELPLAPRGTALSLRVWEALRTIPLGETRSYGELARSLGRPGAARAVGSANAHNPISIVVPCHRVIGGDGSLTGYAGGLHEKTWLLAHERRVAARAV